MAHFILLMTLLTHVQLIQAAEVHVAVASNFKIPMEELSKAFKEATGVELILSHGSTGKLYSQVINGAPFEVLLSADSSHPEKLIKVGKGVEGSSFTYAIGRLILWSPKKNLVDGKGKILSSDRFRFLSIANPKLAPYGLAAKEVLEKEGLWQKLQKKLVLGENINQAHQFVASGNAELGFVALSQITKKDQEEGSWWMVPKELHTPLKQDALLLTKGSNSKEAKLFLHFLKGAMAQKIIKHYGHEVTN